MSLIKLNLDKALEKLITSVSDGIGTLYRPRAIRKEADAKAYEIKALAKARAESVVEAELINIEGQQRIIERITAREIQRQNNIDTVFEIASRELQTESETTVSNEPVEKDWVTRFFNIVQDISDEDMRSLWGKILAGEVRSPSSYSLRTLEVLRNMTKKEAELFSKFCQLVLKRDRHYVYRNQTDLSKYGLSYGDILKLMEIGLVQSDSFITQQFHNIPSTGQSVKVNFVYKNKVIRAKLTSNTKKFSMPVFLLTQAGGELYRLIPVSIKQDYLKDFVLYLKNRNIDVSIADLVSMDETSIKLINEQDVFDFDTLWNKIKDK